MFGHIQWSIIWKQISSLNGIYIYYISDKCASSPPLNIAGGHVQCFLYEQIQNSPWREGHYSGNIMTDFFFSVHSFLLYVFETDSLSIYR